MTATWRAIQDRHADVPDVVLTLGSGSTGARRGEVTLGHFAASRWQATDPATATDHTDEGDEQDQDDNEAGVTDAGRQRPPDLGMAELFVGGEGLRRRFAELGTECVTVAMDGARGWSATALPGETADAADYAGELAQLTEAITAYRRAESGPGTTTTGRNNPPALCGCAPPRRIRVARAVLAAGPIVCGCCGTEFTVDEPDPDRDHPDGDHPDGGSGDGGEDEG